MIHTRVIIVGAMIAIALSLPFYSRTWHLLMHQVGSIIFLGNIMVSALWMSLSKRSGTADGFRLGVRGLMLTDAVFTTPGVLLLLLNGGILGTDFFSSGGNWLFISMTLFLITAIIWIAVLLPAQRRMWRLLENVPPGGAVPSGVESLYKRWFRFGGIATLLPLATLVLMIYKPAL